MHKTFRLLLPSLLLATALAACGDKGADASADGSAPRAKGFNVTAKVRDGDADMAEIERYRFTVDGVRKYSAITAAMSKLDLENTSQATGTAADSAAAEKESDEMVGSSNSASLDETETFLNGNKQARELLAAHGMDTREYVVMSLAMMTVAFAQMAIDQGANADSVAKELKGGAENLKFYKEHRKEFDAMLNASKSAKS